ncbi:MAG TPA: efflux RND transporter permease subunit [Gammaproteobacteria bacterium]|jgi:multidrug efflux pump|nr:efflux RND transporter permease subunit [Gammaproteobacteria bacterium]HIK73071.1 efflux RND transporter permease subunit [Gammaproteobacteria bacterium]
MNNFIKTAIFKSRTSLSILFLLFIAGFYALNYLPKATDPDVSFPGAMIGVSYEGVSPEDSERLLAKPLEDALRTIEGVEKVRSTSTTGFAAVIVEFDQDIDLDKALYDTRVKVDEARGELPLDAREPFIKEFTTSDEPILTISVSSSILPQRVLVNLTQDLQDLIETHPNVLQADLNGVPEDLIEAVVEKGKLESYGISMSQLFQAVSNNNRVIPAGAQDTGKGRFTVNVPSVFSSLEDIQSLPIKVSGSSVVTLEDVADVRLTFKDRGGYSRINGQQSLSIDIMKRSGSNIIDTVNDVRTLVEEASQAFPEGVEINYVRDNSEFALQMISELQGNVLTSVALVMIVVLAALGFRTSMLVGMAIPFSYLFALLVLFVLDKEFNFMVMFGMLISMGMTIDGSIVITEYADRKLAEGMNRVEAYSAAATRMFWPVLSSTVTTLIAFTPLMFMPGFGKFIRDMPITVFCVLVGSLLYSLVFAPILGAMFGGLAKQSDDEINNIRKLESSDPLSLPGATGIYARKVNQFLDTPGQIIFIILSAIILCIGLWFQNGKGVSYFPEVAPQFAQVSISARGNLSVDEIRDLAIEAEQKIIDLEDIEMLSVWSNSGGEMGMRGINPDKVGGMFVDFYAEDNAVSDRDGYEIMDLMRDRLSDTSGYLVTVEAEKGGPPIGKALQLNVVGKDERALKLAIKKIRNYIETEVTGFTNIEDSSDRRGIEWELNIDRTKAAQYGAGLSDVGTAVQMVTNGIKVGEYRPLNLDREVDIRVRFPKEERNIDQLEKLNIQTLKGLVPVSSFVEINIKPATKSITRQNGKRVEKLSAETMPGVVPSDKIKQIKEWLAVTDLGKGVTVEFDGFDKYNQEAADYLILGFIGMLFVMLIVLVAQFNSFYQANIVLSAILLSFGGVFISLLILDRSFSTLQTGISCIALAGIVVNNNIVLIDTFNLLKRNNPGSDTKSIALRSAVLRLRPVFLTSFTTIAGLLPIAMGYSVDLIDRTIKSGGYISSFWEQMAGSLVVGLSVATVLTLVVTPCALALSDSVRRFPKKLSLLISWPFRQIRNLRAVKVKS